MKTKLIVLFILVSPAFIRGQLSESSINVKDGLSSSYIRFITSDSTGLLWIGTDNGLDRFDGKTIVNYANRFKIPLKGAVQHLINVSNTESIIATEQGAFKYNIAENSIQPINFNQPGINVRSICKGQHNQYFFGTDKGVYVLNGDSENAHKIRLNNRDRISEISVMEIISDSDAKIWIATLDGLYSYEQNSKRVTHYQISDAYLSNNLHSLLLYDDILYIGTENGLFNLNSAGKITLTVGTENLCVLSLARQANKLYLGSENSGLKEIDLDHNSIRDISANINTSILSLHIVDSDLWLGTFSEGVLKISLKDTKQFENITIGRNYNFTPRSYLFFQNQIFVGTRDGLAVFNENFQLTERIKPYSKPEFNAKVITCIQPYPGQKNKILIGTYEDGVLIYNLINKKFSKLNIGGLGKSVYKLVDDKKGHLWIATLDGLVRYNPETQKGVFCNLPKRLQTNEIFSLALDHSNRLWIGTKLGICFLDLNSYRFYKPKLDFIEKYQCTSVFVDSQGKIWFCFNKGGVLSIDSSLAHYNWITEEIGTPQNAPSSVVEDKKGGIWIGTQKGLFKITKMGSVLSYNEENGPDGIIFTPESAGMDDEGNLWWLNENGFVKMAPVELEVRNSASKVLFTKLTINGTEYSTDTLTGLVKSGDTYILNIKGKHNNHLNFEFSLVNHNNNKQNRYSYRLMDKNSAWSKPGSSNQIEFADLSTGKHILYVKASSDEQGEITQSVTIEIYINPYFYETSWFIGIVVILVVGITFTLTWSYFKVFIRKMREQFNETRQKTEKTSSLKISNEKCKQIQIDLENYMKNEKPYIHPDFRIGEAAKATGYGLHEISHVLNTELNSNFSDYINSYRIEELMRMMSESLYEKYNLSAIAEKCGFNSKTTFYRAFKKYKGISPSEYFKKIE